VLELLAVEELAAEVERRVDEERAELRARGDESVRSGHG